MIKDKNANKVVIYSLQMTAQLLELMVNCMDNKLLKQSERLYLYDLFDQWLEGSGNRIERLQALLDADGRLLKGQTKALNLLCQYERDACKHLEKFQLAVEDLCHQRALVSDDLSEIKAAYERTKPDTQR